MKNKRLGKHKEIVQREGRRTFEPEGYSNEGIWLLLSLAIVEGKETREQRNTRIKLES